MKNLSKKAYMAVIVLIGSLSFVYQAYANYLYYNADNGYATFSNNVSAPTFIGNLTGNASTATTFSTGRTTYRGVTDGAVAGQLMWKNYGNGHTIFDASNSTSPDGTAVNNTNSAVPWSATYPTLMGWNGASTYGVRVDSARISDLATSQSGGTVNASSAMVGTLSFSGVGGNSGQSAPGSDYRIYQAPGSWAYPYPDLNIAYHTGISIGAYWNYGGTRFFNNSDMATEIFSVGNGDNNVRVANSLYVAGTAYANGQALCQTNGVNCPASSADVDTLQSVTNRGVSTDKVITVAGLTVSGSNMNISGTGDTTYNIHGWQAFGSYDGWDVNKLYINGYGNFSSGTTVAGTGGLRVDSNLSVGGNINATDKEVKAGSFIYASDRTLKKEIEIIPDALDKVLQLEGVMFKWKKDGRPDLGLIAQDVEKVFPDLVHTDQITNLKSVEYGNLVAPLIEAIKEQQKQIEEQKNQNLQLQLQINDLKSQIEMIRNK